MKPIKRSVLVIDDEPTDRYILRRLLKKANICGDVFEVKNGQQALDFLIGCEENKHKHADSRPPDAIFLDFNMPVMNGFEFLEAFSTVLNRQRNHHSLIFAMINRFACHDDREKAVSFNCVSDCISKDDMSSETLNALFHRRFSNPIRSLVRRNNHPVSASALEEPVLTCLTS